MPGEDIQVTGNPFEDKVIDIIRAYNLGLGFSDIKLTDTPKDNNQVVPRKYVTLNGTTLLRPTGSIIGQFYLDTTLNKPVWYSPKGWIDATGANV